MLKILFWLLLLANAGLFAYETGYLAAWLPDGHEPGRLAHQLNAESMKPVPIGVIETRSDGDKGQPDTAAVKSEPAWCSEIGAFDPVAAKRFDTTLQALTLGDKLSRREVEDVAHNIVYIPPQGSKEAAEKKATELRHLGVNEFYVIQDAGDLRWGISLGVFKTEEAARAQLAALSQKGVHSARLGTRNVSSIKVYYQVHDLDGTAKAGLDKALLDFPHVERHACGSESGESKPEAKPADAKAPEVKSAAAPKASYPRDVIH